MNLKVNWLLQDKYLVIGDKNCVLKTAFSPFRACNLQCAMYCTAIPYWGISIGLKLRNSYIKGDRKLYNAYQGSNFNQLRS